MEQTLNISAEDLFGAASQLVAQGGSGTLSGIASLGGAYQAATGVVALLFIFILVRYFDLFRHLIVSSFSRQSSRSDIHIYSSELKNIELFTSLMGVMMLSLLVMRLSVFETTKHLFAPLAIFSGWEIGAVALAAILGTMLGERIMLYIIGGITGRNDACNTIWHIKLLHFSIIIILLVPFSILVLLTEGITAQIALCVSIAICSLMLILFVKETFLLFRAQRFSIFHWILYLCALEFFPLSLLFAPIVRG